MSGQAIRRLSLVLVPVRLFPATWSEGTIAFRMIHKPSGKPIKYLKGVETEQGFEEIHEEEIIKGYEHAKGHHVLISDEEVNSLKLEAKHTIDMKMFVDLDQIDSRYFRSPTTCCTMATKPTKAIRCCVTHSRTPEAVKLAVDLIEQQSGKFEPQKMPNEYAHAVES